MFARRSLVAWMAVALPLNATAQTTPLMRDPPDPWVPWAGRADEPTRADLRAAQQAVQPWIEGCLSTHREFRLEAFTGILVSFWRDGQVRWTRFDRRSGQTSRCISIALHRMRVPRFAAQHFVVVDFSMSGSW